MAVEHRSASQKSIPLMIAATSSAALGLLSAGRGASACRTFLAPSSDLHSAEAPTQSISLGIATSVYGSSEKSTIGIPCSATAGAAVAAVTFAAVGARRRGNTSQGSKTAARRYTGPGGKAVAGKFCGTASVDSSSGEARTARANFQWPFEQHSGKKTVVITGASSGLGLAAAKHLARSGEWLVIMACRDFSKGEAKARELNLPADSYKIMHLDLACQESVRSFVRSFRSLERPLDALVCNAAVYFPNAHKPGVILPGLFPGGGPRWSPDGMELSFATNYLGHFLLCNLMLEDLKKSQAKPARCIILGTVTASVNGRELGGQILPLANVGNLEGLQKGMKQPITMVDGGEFDGAKAYKDSKVCDVMLMRELHKRYHNETGIAFSSLYPGCIAETNLFREHYPVFQSLFPAFHKTVTRAYVSEDEAGARLASVVSDERYSTSGAYYSWEGAAGTGGSGGKAAVDNTEKSRPDWFSNVGSFRTLQSDEIGGEAGDDERCRKLWEFSEQLVADREVEMA